jgi:hypothetical protein
LNEETRFHIGAQTRAVSPARAPKEADLNGFRTGPDRTGPARTGGGYLAGQGRRTATLPASASSRREPARLASAAAGRRRHHHRRRRRAQPPLRGRDGPRDVRDGRCERGRVALKVAEELLLRRSRRRRRRRGKFQPERKDADPAGQESSGPELGADLSAHNVLQLTRQRYAAASSDAVADCEGKQGLRTLSLAKSYGG